MRIEEKELDHWINHFYGYGSWNAKFWFVGYEETGGDTPEEVAEKFNFFFKASSSDLCDIRELYRQLTYLSEGPKADLFTTRHDYRFGDHAIQNSIWKNLSAFVHGYESKKLPDPLRYQKESVASPSLKKEALLSLYPLPAPHNHAWYYSWLDMPSFPFLKSRTQYQDFVYRNRIQTILMNIRSHQPEVVLMYGMNNINKLKESFNEFFGEVKFKSVKAIKLQIPQHHIADLNKTKLIITTQIPALRHNRIETGFDWYEFGKMIQG